MRFLFIIILFVACTMFYKANAQETNSCQFDKFPASYDVYAVSSYEGHTQISTVIDKSGNRNGLNDVIVNVKNKPIILVLSAYEPVVWRIQRTAETRIAGVVLGGYYNQAILGISKTIPVLNYTYSKRNCGYFYLSETLDNESVQSIQKIQEITGKKPVNIEYNYKGNAFNVGKPLSSTDKLVYSQDYNLSDYQVDLKTISGSIPETIRTTNEWKENATVYLVNNNYIRKATATDIKNWENKAREPYRQTIGNSVDQMRINHLMSTGHTYVVLKTFKIPDDFCYGHFINFIIPDGVQAPENKQNCGFYFLKNGSDRDICPNGNNSLEKRKPAIYLYPNGDSPARKDIDYKPAIYLYPQKPLKVHITLDKSVLITYDAPRYAPGIGWNVLVYPDGRIQDLQPQYTDCNKLDKNKFGLEYATKACKENNYPYIFWEGETTRKPVPDSKEGWVVETGKLQGFFNEKLNYIGFNKAEKEEFIRYWTTVLANKQTSYFIYFLQTDEVNELAPMTVEPKPTSTNRIYMVARPLKNGIAAPQPQKLERFKRKGFTLVEWGGSIK